MKILAKWTLKDYHHLIEAGILEGRQVELLAGDIVEMSPEGSIHAFVTEGGVEYLRSLLSGLALVREAHPITLENSEPQPDITIVRLPRSLYRDRHPYAEDIFWLIEISQSTLAYDLNDKKIIYAQAGIREYWVVDLSKQQVYIFRQPQGNDYEIKLVLNQGEISPLSFPNIKISLERFWID